MTHRASLEAICLAGPTASGKSAAAMAIAQALPVEIVSVDSALVYRGLDIGTAKPTPADRATVPHHLIDILDPRERYSAAAFVADARRLVAAIRGAAGVPLLVGGTMLYFKALVDGLDAMPAADEAVRAALEAEAAARGWPAMHAELQRVDPVTAARLPPGDAQRIQRALEVWRVSGRPLSSWQAGPAARETQPQAWPLISMEPLQRATLHERIAQRLQAMLAAGFLDEVRALRARGDLDPGLPSMRCVGYRQAWAALDDGSAAALAAWPAQALAATRQLAKRQLTWLRGLPARHRIACDEPDATRRAVEAATRTWEAAHGAA